MNNKILLIAALSLCLLACTKTSSPTGTSATQQVPPGPNPEGCSVVQLTLTLNVNSIMLVPAAPKCVIAGTSVKIKINTPGDKVAISDGSVTTKPKTGTPDWLNGSNSPDKSEIKLDIDASATVGMDYSYDIEIAGHGKLDPKVKVVGNISYLKASEWDRKYYEAGQLNLLETTTGN